MQTLIETRGDCRICLGIDADCVKSERDIKKDIEENGRK